MSGSYVSLLVSQVLAPKKLIVIICHDQINLISIVSKLNRVDPDQAALFAKGVSR